jgi:hypothetical protein
MSQVQAVEHPDGGADRSGRGLQFVGQADDVHEGGRVRCIRQNGKEKVCPADREGVDVAGLSIQDCRYSNRFGRVFCFHLLSLDLSRMLSSLWARGARLGNVQSSSCFSMI